MTDNVSLLMWQFHTVGPMNWDDAGSYASALVLGGHSDWRLPTKDELFGLYNSSCKEMMNVEESTYWSGTTDVARSTSYAWRVYFYYGYVVSSDKSYSNYVRAVRAGQ